MPPNRLDMLWAAIPLRHRDERSDAELLARFLDERDAAAFEALLVRHTPGVRAACKGWLRAEADVDDAAQATFLILVQRAGSIRDRAALGAWLYGVASNVARRLRRQRPTLPLPHEVPGLPPKEPCDLGPLLAEEIDRLPEKYRLPVQLCYSAGLSTAEAARCLGWPKGTVLTRLAWARERLKKSLQRRGVSPTVVLGLAGRTPVPLDPPWVHLTVRAASSLLAGESPAFVGVSGRTIALTEGVVRAMFWNRLKFVALAVLVLIGGVGLGIHWAVAAAGPGGERTQGGLERQQALKLPAGEKDRDQGDAPAAGKEAGKADPRGAALARRREAVIRLPVGTFVKEVEVRPYGSGRLTWTYEEDRVSGLIEASGMGFELELATEAEISLSSNGTIYGLITSVQLRHLALPDGKDLGDLKPLEALWGAAEPLVNDLLLDVPFSYNFRMQGDRLILSNFRILLAGPNPLGKLGGAVAGLKEFAPIAYFQVLSTALEGTYIAEGKEQSAPIKRGPFFKPRSRLGSKPTRK
jgi:DNA-directed RNA polymerase specialized sigma24 family protein